MRNFSVRANCGESTVKRARNSGHVTQRIKLAPLFLTIANLNQFSFQDFLAGFLFIPLEESLRPFAILPRHTFYRPMQVARSTH